MGGALTCPAGRVPLRRRVEDVINGNGGARVAGGDLTVAARLQVVRVRRAQLEPVLNAGFVQAGKRQEEKQINQINNRTLF